MSKLRLFQESSERDGGVFRRVARVTCRQCGVSTSMPMKAGKSSLPPDVIARKLEQKGWTIGNNEQWDYCPAHDPKKKEKPNLKLVPAESIAATAATAAAQQPRQMDREHRRIIFEKLNEVYLDETRGYEAGWSDHRVATDLGVPRKWVETIRDENFGAIGTSPEMAEFLSEAESLLFDARKTLDDCQKTRAEVQKMVDQITALLSGPDQKAVIQISDRLGAVERLADKVRKLVV